MKKRLSLFITFFIAVGLLAACAANDQETNESRQANNDGQVETNEEQETSFPVTVTDAFDNEVTITEKPERIVSIIPPNTETLFALGLDDEIVGVSDFCDFPEEALEKETIGGQDFNVEKIISLEPDIVFSHGSSGYHPEDKLEQIRAAGIQVVIVNSADSFEGAYDAIRMIATATGTEEKGEEIINEMKAEIAAIAEKAQDIPEDEEMNVWIEIEPSPNLYTTGKNTFMHEMLETIHANNVASDQEGWVPFTEEDAVKLNPDVIVTTYGSYYENAREDILSRPAWQDVPAVKKERVYNVDEALVSRSGPRLAEGVEELATAIYPEIFAE